MYDHTFVHELCLCNKGKPHLGLDEDAKLGKKTSPYIETEVFLKVGQELCLVSEGECNGPDPPLANIVLFGLSLSGFPSRH